VRWAFRVGQKVVCINSGEGDQVRFYKDEALIQDYIYTIRSVHLHDGHPVLWLEEVRRDDASIDEWGPLVGYSTSRFRPVVERKTDISIFTALLKTRPISVDEKV
jgi:hypothetical protein